MSSTAEDVHPGQPEPSPEDDLTERQRKVVHAIRDSIEKCGFPPSLREIGDAVELKSTSAVSHQLSVLETKGVLRRQPGRSRAIELLQPSAASTPEDAAVEVLAQEIVLVPLMGRIAAGPPMLAEENVEDTFPVPSWLLPGSGRVFLLKIVGDSMIGAGIRNEDLVLVRSQPGAENGDIVAAMIDDEATVKTLTRSAGHVWLMPHNQAYTPIPGDDAIILGKVVSVFRKVGQ
jgi:repressor LexA